MIELVTTVAILGILSTISLPGLLSHLYRSRQQACAATMSQALITTQDFYDENGVEASGWKDLTETAAIMTVNGPATNSDFSEIQISKDFKLSASKTTGEYNYACTPTSTAASNYNVLGCLRTLNGAVQINLGSHSGSAETAVCT